MDLFCLDDLMSYLCHGQIPFFINHKIFYTEIKGIQAMHIEYNNFPSQHSPQFLKVFLEPWVPMQCLSYQSNMIRHSYRKFLEVSVESNKWS